MTGFFSISVLHEFGGLGLGVHYDHILQIIPNKRKPYQFQKVWDPVL
jgi:hypothetical protein